MKIEWGIRILEKKKWWYPVLLVIGFGLLIGFVMPKDGVYGSVTDWFSQHVALAETIRTACLEQKTLLPTMLPLGGGSNGFQFAYYGYLRPDILLGCLLPQVPMLYIMIGYMLAGYLAAILLFYNWCSKELSSPAFAFLGSILFMTANCFFQTHRQVMFINYLPFLVLVLLCIQRKKYPYIGILLTLMLFHSFYYILPILVVLGWYWYQKVRKEFLRPYLVQVGSGIGMAALLLVPTALVILEHRRTSADAMNLETGVWEPHMEFFLYSPYGMGMTVLCLYLLLSGLANQKYRRNSLCMLLVISLGWSAYLLNGTLYARGKIMVPFLPLLVLHCVRILQDNYQNQKRWRQWQFLIIVGIMLLAKLLVGYRLGIGICVDVAVLFVISVLLRVRPAWKGLYALLLIMPVIFYIQTGRTEDYVSVETAKELEAWQKQEYTVDTTDARYRADTLYEYLNTSNRVNAQINRRSSMYSSVTNQAYSNVYYDYLQTPIRINNRVAIVTEQNPFMLQFMGVRYLEARKGQLPYGYEAVESRGDLVLGENEGVLPVAYGVSGQNTIPEAQFETADANQKLELLMKQTVVTDEAYDKNAADMEEKEEPIYEIKQTVVDGQLSGLPEGLDIQKISEDAWLICASKTQSLTYTLDTASQDELLLLQFDVVNKGKQAVVIDINNIRNKLSGSHAPYPNGNTKFHYQFAGTKEQPLTKLTITLSKGTYELRNPSWYHCPASLLQEKEYQTVEPDIDLETENNLFAGTITMPEAGYLVTSIPLQRGMQLYVDGKAMTPERVNLAFAGVYLSAGTHTVRLDFTPPGLYWGMGISLAGFFVYLGQLGYWYRRRAKEKGIKSEADRKSQ